MLLVVVTMLDAVTRYRRYSNTAIGIGMGKVQMVWDRAVCAGLPGRPGPRAAVAAAAAGPGGAAEEPGRRLLCGRPPI